MARKVKFPLKMADGTEARTLDELREHFDSESVVGYFHDGRLLTWLRSRYYDDEADKVASLTKDDPQLYKKLCAIFGVEAEVEELDTEKIAQRQERLNRLKQYTYDKEVLERVDLVAFDQEDLSDLLDEDKPLIYLCGNKFVIPLRETHKTYIGVGKAIAVIRSNKIVDFDELNIEFKNVLFDDNYAALLKEQELAEQKRIAKEKASRPKKLYDEGEAAYDAGDYATALEKYKQAADLGYAKALYSIAIIYKAGRGVQRNLEEAKRWIKLGMEKGDGDSFGFKGLIMLEKENVTEAEKIEAFSLIKRATETGTDSYYWYRLGKMYRNGEGTEKNPAEAFSCFKKGHELGNAYCTNMLGIMFSDGEYVDKNRAKAVEFYKQAADAGNISAINNLAGYYRHGEVVDKDLKKAFELYKRAAEAGRADAMNAVGNMYYGGEGTSQNYNEAFRWYKKAADEGYAWGTRNLALMYREGKGTSKNIHKAIELFTKAAECGNIDALVQLGEIYHDDDSGITDYQKAAFYFKKAADAGSGEGMNDLGLLYDWGHGVAEDKKLAFQWYLRGAEAGFLAGMAHVGQCYLRGKGTSKNMSQAGYWLRKAAEGGNGWGMVYYGDYLFERNSSSALDWYKKAFDKKQIGEIAYKIYKIYKDGRGVAKNSSQADYWERKYKSLGYKPADGGCFITTAVCDSFGKPDNCFELTTFRKFRDTWLVAQPDGKSLITEYYSVAPAIVAKINSLPNAAQIYDNIRRKYLEPCLAFMEQGDNQSCKRLYVDMVTSLKKKFLEG